VTLKSGTNEIVLKVGMQMRRSEDGSWSATDQPANSYTSNSGRSSNSNSNDRRSDSGRNRSRNGGASGNASEGNPGNAMMPPDSGMPLPIPPEVGNLDPNDPVARLMLRRLQEEGGVPPAPVENQPQENPPVENSQSENPDTTTNNPAENNPNAQPER
jgi:hypothetical protein